MIVLKLAIFGLSSIGSFELIRRISGDKINIYFLPSLTVAIQVTLLYLAGILNLLPEVTIALYILGFVGLRLSYSKNKSLAFIKQYYNDGYLLFILIMLFLTICLHGKMFSHYDNFSHWALVVRDMLVTNHYPNFESALISFQEYPLGSATYIYYFAKMVSASESTQMLAQAYMIIAAILPLFAVIQKRSIAVDVVFFLIANFVCVYNITLGNLLVDTLLPVVGICALLFAKIHCFKDDNNNFLFLSCYLVQLIQIKNSGLFFVAVILIVGAKYYLQKENRLSKIACALMPFISLVIWQKHCKYVFTSAATSKHAMTLANYRMVLGGKSFADVKTICIEMIKLSITYIDVWIIILLALIIGCFVRLYYRDIWKNYIELLKFTGILYVCYQIGTLGMYLFSMPGEEATRLAGGERYLKTILLAILLIYLIFTIRIISSEVIKKRANIISVIVVILTYSMSVSSLIVPFVPFTIGNGDERMWVENSKESYSIPSHNSYCILIPEEDWGYSDYLLRYTFWSDEVTTKIIEDADDMKEIDSKYILVYDKENDIINSWISEKYPSQLGNDVIIQ